MTFKKLPIFNNGSTGITCPVNGMLGAYSLITTMTQTSDLTKSDVISIIDEVLDILDSNQKLLTV
jgi:hypothetical protein